MTYTAELLNEPVELLHSRYRLTAVSGSAHGVHETRRQHGDAWCDELRPPVWMMGDPADTGAEESVMSVASLTSPCAPARLMAATRRTYAAASDSALTSSTQLALADTSTEEDVLVASLRDAFADMTRKPTPPSHELQKR